MRITRQERRFLQKIGKRGGKAKVPKGFAKLTKAERTENAHKAAAARWKKPVQSDPVMV